MKTRIFKVDSNILPEQKNLHIPTLVGMSCKWWCRWCMEHACMFLSGTIVADGICSTLREKLKVGKWPTGMIQKEWIIQNVPYQKFSLESVLLFLYERICHNYVFLIIGTIMMESGILMSQLNLLSCHGLSWSIQLSTLPKALVEYSLLWNVCQKPNQTGTWQKFTLLTHVSELQK